MKKYIGEGLLVEYTGNQDNGMRIIEETLGYLEKHHIYLDKQEYQALRRFAQAIGWEEEEKKS